MEGGRKGGKWQNPRLGQHFGSYLVFLLDAECLVSFPNLLIQLRCQRGLGTWPWLPGPRALLPGPPHVLSPNLQNAGATQYISVLSFLFSLNQLQGFLLLAAQTHDQAKKAASVIEARGLFGKAPDCVVCSCVILDRQLVTGIKCHREWTRESSRIMLIYPVPETGRTHWLPAGKRPRPSLTWGRVLHEKRGRRGSDSLCFSRLRPRLRD